MQRQNELRDSFERFNKKQRDKIKIQLEVQQIKAQLSLKKSNIMSELRMLRQQYHTANKEIDP